MKSTQSEETMNASQNTEFKEAKHESREDCLKDREITFHYDRITGDETLKVPKECRICGREWKDLYQYIDTQE